MARKNKCLRVLAVLVVNLVAFLALFQWISADTSAVLDYTDDLSVPLAPSLPADCIGGTPGDPCCINGYVFDYNTPVQSATVTIESPNGIRPLDLFTDIGEDSSHPYYSANPNSWPLFADAGDVITITATYSGIVSVRTWVVQAGGQQVDLGLVTGASIAPAVDITFVITPTGTQDDSPVYDIRIEERDFYWSYTWPGWFDCGGVNNNGDDEDDYQYYPSPGWEIFDDWHEFDDIETGSGGYDYEWSAELEGGYDHWDVNLSGSACFGQSGWIEGTFRFRSRQKRPPVPWSGPVISGTHTAHSSQGEQLVAELPIAPHTDSTRYQVSLTVNDQTYICNSISLDDNGETLCGGQGVILYLQGNQLYVKNYPDLDVGFTPLSFAGSIPLDVQYVDQSIGYVAAWDWEFGDGSVSGARHPRHVFDYSDDYTTTLTVTGFGNSDTQTQVAHIVAEPAPPDASLHIVPSEGDTTTDFAFYASGSSDVEDPLSFLGARFDWEDDGIYDTGWIAAAKTVTHTFPSPGIYVVRIQVRDSDGLLDSATRAVLVKTLNAQFVAGPRSVSLSQTTVFTNTSTGDYAFCLWDFGDGLTSTVCNPVHTYMAAGTYTVSLSIIGPGDSDTRVKSDYIQVADGSPPAWTFLLYLAGDNDLGGWLEYALQRLSVADNPNVRVVALLDRSGDGNTEIVEYVYGAVNYTGNIPWRPGVHELNMGDPQTLSDFVNWARDMFPARYTYLAISDHGGGIRGTAWDHASSDDNLTMPELEIAFDAIAVHNPAKLDLVHYDSCLMAMVELAYQLEDHANFLVASENTGFGVFAYDQYVGSVGSATTPHELAEQVADIYFQALPNGPVTISAMDLAYVDDVALSIDTFAQRLIGGIASYPQQIGESWYLAQKLNSREYLVIDDRDEFVDIYHLAELIKQNVPNADIQDAAQGVMDAIGAVGGGFLVQEHHQSGTFWDNYWDLDNAHGLSMYFPPDNGVWGYADYIGSGSGLVFDTQWDEFLVAFLGYAPLPPDPRTAPGIPPMLAPGPSLSIADNVHAIVGEAVKVPIDFSSFGHDIITSTFSIGYDQNCLLLDDTDGDGDGAPDSITFGLSETFHTTVITDTNGRLHFLVADTWRPPISLPDGNLVTMTFTATCRPDWGDVITAPLSFSDAPSSWFDDGSGQGILGTTHDGFVEIFARPVRVALPLDARGFLGDQVTLPLRVIDDVTGLGIYAFEFNLFISDTVLLVGGVAQQGAMSENWKVTYHSMPGQVNVAGYGTSPLEGSGELLFLTFDVIGAVGSETDLLLDDFMFNEARSSVAAQHGHLAVQSFPNVISGSIGYILNAMPVPTVTLNVTGTNNGLSIIVANGNYSFTVEETESYTVTLSKEGDIRGALSALDAAWIAQSVVESRNFGDEQVRACDVSNDGACTAFDASLIARYLVGLADPSAKAGEWEFEPPQRIYHRPGASLGSEDYTAFLAGDVTFNWGVGSDLTWLQSHQSQQDEMTVSLPSLDAVEGQIVTVPVRANPGIAWDAIGYELVISFDPGIAEIAGLSVADSLSADWSLVENHDEPGLVRIVGYGVESLSGEGALLNLTFKIVGTAGQQTALSIESLRVNEGQVPVQASDGQIRVAPASHAIFLPVVMSLNTDSPMEAGGQ